MSRRRPKRDEYEYTAPTGSARVVIAAFVLFWRGLFGGIIAVIALPVLVFFVSLCTGSGQPGYPTRGAGPPVSPMGASAARNALGSAVVVGFLGAIPAFVFGSIVGAVVSVRREIRKR